MKGKDYKEIAKMLLDAYIKDDGEYNVEMKGFPHYCLLSSHEVEEVKPNETRKT